MADYNSVPLGQAGTGAAVVLGQSQAANRYIDQLDKEAQARAAAQALKQKQAQQLAEDWQKNTLKAEGGQFWQQEFDKRQQEHLNKGLELRKQGINPFGAYDVNNPQVAKAVQDYQLERQAILSDLDVRKAKEAELGKLFNAYKTSPGKYRAKSFEELNKYAATPFGEVRNAPIPALQEGFDLETEFYKIADPVTEDFKDTVKLKNGSWVTQEGRRMKKAETRAIGESILANNQKGKTFIEDTIGLPIEQVKKIPNTFEANIKGLIEDYNGDPNLRDMLASQYGVTTLDQARPYLEKEAKDRFEKKKQYNGILDTFEQRAKAKANEGFKETPFFGYEDQELQRAAARRAAKSGESTNLDVDARRQIIKNIQDFVPNAAEEIGAFVNGNPNYSSDSKFAIVADPKHPKDNRFFLLDVPAKVKLDAKGNEIEVTPRTKFSLNRSDPNFETKMNEIINNVTGQRMDIGASMGLQGNTKGSTVKTTTKTNSTSPKKAVGGYKIGQVVSGYKYTGGDPTKQSNWTKI